MKNVISAMRKPGEAVGKILKRKKQRAGHGAVAQETDQDGVQVFKNAVENNPFFDVIPDARQREKNPKQDNRKKKGAFFGQGLFDERTRRGRDNGNL